MELIFQFFCFKSTNHLNTKNTINKLTVILIVMFISVNLVAQEEEIDETPYWYVISIKIPLNKIDSPQQLLYKLYNSLNKLSFNY